jgi:nuclear cap-binding protein subunit 1
MVALLQSFTAVLEEFGVSHGRAKRAAICAGEGLMMVCQRIVSCSTQNAEIFVRRGRC